MIDLVLLLMIVIYTVIPEIKEKLKLKTNCMRFYVIEKQLHGNFSSFDIVVKYAFESLRTKWQCQLSRMTHMGRRNRRNVFYKQLKSRLITTLNFEGSG